MRPYSGRVDEYIKSGRWKCEKSQSGSHYWIITGATMNCRFCKEIREVQGIRPLRHKGVILENEE